jgi:hypothetical protein
MSLIMIKVVTKVLQNMSNKRRSLSSNEKKLEKRQEKNWTEKQLSVFIKVFFTFDKNFDFIVILIFLTDFGGQAEV